MHNEDKIPSTQNPIGETTPETENMAEPAEYVIPQTGQVVNKEEYKEYMQSLRDGSGN